MTTSAEWTRLTPSECALCGHDPACGMAQAFDDHTVVTLCHSDGHVSCYHLWTVYGMRSGGRPAEEVVAELRKKYT